MISYSTENVKSPKIPRKKISEWIKRVAGIHGKNVGNIGYLFCNNERILEVNRQYLSHDYYTDVITFDYSCDNTISGDVFISLETVSDNAKDYGVSFENELCRVIIHAVLHLCGYCDATDEEAKMMRKLEKEALELI